MAEANGLGEGDPLPYDLVAGASIGAFNAFFTSTAQYARMRSVWLEAIPQQPIFTLKAAYAKIPDASSGVLTRLHSAVRLAAGATNGVRGVVDPATIKRLLEENCSPSVPVGIPMCFTATNLTRARLEIFMRRGTSAVGQARQAYVDTRTIGSAAMPLRPVSDELLRDALFASAALPIVFDPVALPRPDGSGTDEYLDGGIADNVPIDIAQKVAAFIDVVAVNPPRDESVELNPANAIDILAGVFGVMQERIDLLATRLAFSEGLAMRSGVSPASFEYDGYELTISRIRPETALPGDRADFSDRVSIAAMFEIGRNDGRRGFQRLVPSEVFD